MAFEPSDWIPTADGLALIRNNRPLLAYLAGKPARFTSKDHNFQPGETVVKQLIILNNSRETVTCDCEWSLELAMRSRAGRPNDRRSKEVTVTTGQQERLPITFELPRSSWACDLSTESSRQVRHRREPGRCIRDSRAAEQGAHREPTHESRSLTRRAQPESCSRAWASIATQSKRPLTLRDSTS